MVSPDWSSVFVAHGRVRSFWRILLFAGLFWAILQFTAVAGFAILALVDLDGPRIAMLPQWIAALVAALAAGWILISRLDGRRPGAIGSAWTPASPAESFHGLWIGIASLGLVVAVLAFVGWIAYRPQPGTVGGFLWVLAADFAFFGLAAAAEEAIFRGYPFQVLVQGIGAVAATLLASAAFAAAHLNNPGITGIALFNIFLAGVMLSAAYFRTRTLWFPTAIHLGWNWSMATIFDLPVSGLDFLDTPLYQPVVEGPDWVTGGAFGPEAGIPATVALLLALLAVWKFPAIGVHHEMRALRPLVDERG